MNLNDYQKKAITTGRDKGAKDEFFHLVLGLVGESGEIAEKVKKLIRDKNSDLSQVDIDDMKKELGDVLWYTASLANYLNIDLEDIAQTNLDKLSSRKQRGLIGGDGDNR